MEKDKPKLTLKLKSLVHIAESVQRTCSVHMFNPCMLNHAHAHCDNTFARSTQRAHSLPYALNHSLRATLVRWCNVHMVHTCRACNFPKCPPPVVRPPNSVPNFFLTKPSSRDSEIFNRQLNGARERNLDAQNNKNVLVHNKIRSSNGTTI